MGCSASRPSTLLQTKEQNLTSSSSSSSLENSSFSSSNSNSNSSPVVARAFSLQTPLVHHPPSKKGDSHHLVSLTSSTYGSLLLNQPTKSKSKCKSNPQNPTPFQPQSSPKNNTGESLSPDSVINTWELMDGLLDDDDDDLGFHQIGITPKLNSSFHQLGSDCFAKKVNSCYDSVKSDDEIVPLSNSSFSNSKPLWKLLSEESFLSHMDPNVVSSYRRALSSRQLGGYSYNYTTNEPKKTVGGGGGGGSVGSSPMNKNPIFIHNNPVPDEKIVVYFTSLRGIRKTYEDCCAVRMILRGFRVPVDERDISMDSSYRKELQQSMVKGKAMSLPQVFIRGKHVGGVEEIRQLNEAGELGKLFEGFPVKDPKTVFGECENCGDARFVPCSNCNGSRKVFDLELRRRCPSCNENGLVRCPSCC